MSDEERKEPGYEEIAMQQARQIGQILREQYQMQEVPDPIIDENGVNHGRPYVPPPSFTDIPISQVGHNGQIHY